jgi:hypothetical protein
VNEQDESQVVIRCRVGLATYREDHIGIFERFSDLVPTVSWYVRVLDRQQ